MFTRLAFVVTFLFSSSVYASQDANFEDEVIKARTAREKRERLATAYRQMANCLHSNKKVSECKSDLQKGCADAGQFNCNLTADLDRRPPKGSQARNTDPAANQD
jgi:hypothetical protein